MRHLLRRFQPPGTAPGTLAARERAVEAPTTLSLITYSEDSMAETEVSSVREAVALGGRDRRNWLRVVGHDEATLREIGEVLGVHPLTLEDVWNLGQRPKIEEHSGYSFAVLQVIRNAREASFGEEQVSLIIFPELLVTIEEREVQLFQPVVSRVKEARGRIRSSGVDYLAYALIDTVVDCLFPVLQGVSERLDAVEEGLMLDQPEVSDAEELHRLRRVLMRVRRVALPTREMTGALSRLESAVFSKQSLPFLRDVHDHAVEILEIASGLRDAADGLMELHLSRVSNRMNEVMKVLTVIATIFIPLTFIVGVYGMNFDPGASPWNMPELQWRFAYPAVWLVMIGLVAGMVVAFRRRGWL